MQPIPSGLKKDPIVEAVCEIRFENPTPGFDAVLLGVLFNKFRLELPEIERLAAAELPDMLRDHDPGLRYAPSHRLKGKSFSVAVGARAINVGVSAPYPGWEKFRQYIERVFAAVFEQGPTISVDRASLKYVNLLEIPVDVAWYEALKVSFKLGDEEIGREAPTHLRHEIKSGDLVSVLQIAYPAQLKTEKQAHRRVGVMLDVDVIKMPIASGFARNHMVVFDEIHTAEKRCFFNLLDERALKIYEPR